jgi:hypothetical protein
VTAVYGGMSGKEKQGYTHSSLPDDPPLIFWTNYPEDGGILF